MHRTPTAALMIALLTPPTVALAAAPDESSEPRLEDLVELPAEGELTVGSEAPELHIREYLKGEPIGSLGGGTVHVVEFWATWCGPCIAAFPHLTELNETYGDAVRFVGVNIWERTSGDERRENVAAFVEDQDERMGYTVALESGSKMAETWMRSAGQSGIPAAFIVDGDGRIAWIGHPMALDEPLETVTSDSYDLEALKRETRRETLMMTGLRTAVSAYQSGEGLDEARTIANILVDQHLSGKPEYLAALAMYILESPAEGVTPSDHQIGVRAAAKACEASGWDSWMPLHAYALAMHTTGDTNAAIKWQEKAVDLAKADDEAPAQAVNDLTARLEAYRNE